MKNFNKQEFDERQLWIRGNVFKHTTIVLAFGLIINAFLRDYNLIWAPGRMPDIVLLMLAATLALYELILRDVIDTNGPMRWFFYFFGALSIVAVILVFLTTIKKQSPLILNGQLTDDGGNLIIVLLIVPVCPVFLFKSWKNRKDARFA